MEAIRAPRSCAVRRAASSAGGGSSWVSAHAGMITVSAPASSRKPRAPSKSSPSAVRTGPSPAPHNCTSYHEGTSKSCRGPKTSHATAISNIGRPAVTGVAIRGGAGFSPKLSFLRLVPRRPVLIGIALGVVYVVWGTTSLAIRVGVGHLPPLLFAGIRYVIAGALLYPIAVRAAARDRGPGASRERPGGAAWLAAAVVGILLLFAGNGGVTFAETSLPSGFAAVLVATVPLWMIIFARLVQGERVTWRSAAGLAVGLAGVAILVGNHMAAGG